LQEKARANKLGLWAEENPGAPWQWLTMAGYGGVKSGVKKENNL